MRIKKNELVLNVAKHISIIKDARSMAIEAHYKDLRDSGKPYITHPISVAESYYEYFPNDKIGLAASLIHDVIEKSSIRAFLVTALIVAFKPGQSPPPVNIPILFIPCLLL